MAQIVSNSPTHILLVKELVANSKKKLIVVDYGCGEGELLHYLPTGRIKRYHGYDVNQSSIEAAQRQWFKKKTAHFSVINRRNLPKLGKKNSVDAIFLIGVIQYLPAKDLTHVLKQAQYVLKPQGKILISSTIDHAIYKWINIYRFFLQTHTVNKITLDKQLVRNGLDIINQFEAGLFVAPFFSNVLVFFFDGIDKLLFRTKGTLGKFGLYSRKLFSPIIAMEFKLPINYGYTLFTIARRSR